MKKILPARPSQAARPVPQTIKTEAPQKPRIPDATGMFDPLPLPPRD